MSSSICEYSPDYQQSLKSLQNEDFEIVGYARKSPNTSNTDTRIRLLQSMTNNLRSRSSATRVYVSACSQSSTPFIQRDIKKDEIYRALNKDVDGNTQGKE